MKKVSQSGLVLAFALMLLTIGPVLRAQQAQYPQQTFNTTIYFDYAYFLSSKGPKTTAAQNNFFTFRRAYFTYENRVLEKLRFRFRYDADYVAAVDAKGKKDDKLRPFLKHLYLEWTDFLIPNSRLRVGMADTLTWKPAEDKWNYRSVAKTLLDNFKDVTGEDPSATSADLGIWYAGSVSKEVRYAFMVTNGAHYSHPENDKYKKFMGQLHFVPLAGFSLVGYVDYEKKASDKSAFTYKLDSYLEMVKNLTIGAEYFVYDNDLKLTSDKRQYNMSGFSLFGRYVLKPDVLAAFARYDIYEPNNKVDNNKISLGILGVDWAPLHASMKLQPNIWIYTYQDSNKKTDVIFNMTFFLSF
jgi:hypothetical protein